MATQAVTLWIQLKLKFIDLMGLFNNVVIEISKEKGYSYETEIF